NAQRPRHHLTAKLLAKPVMLLTAKELRGWRDRLSDGGMKAATLNRHLRALKAALTLAAAHDPERVTNRDAWRVGLAGLPDAHNVVLPETDIRALIAAAWEADAAFGLWCETAAVTGARPSQLGRLDVADLQDGRADPRLMMPSSKKGRGHKRVERKPVPIPL